MQKLSNDTVKEYNCVGKPWVFEITLEPADMSTTPSDLKQQITILGINEPNKLQICRMAEKVAFPIRDNQSMSNEISRSTSSTGTGDGQAAACGTKEKDNANSEFICTSIIL